MINIRDKKLCCGCSACATICPKKAIEMHEDYEGATYPEINKELCINCGLCENVCPMLEPKGAIIPANNQFKPYFYAAQLKNKAELNHVSSGGAFWGLAQTVLNNNGIVYGAVQENVGVIKHKRADNFDAAKKFRGSKYLQSDTNGIYALVKEDLKNNLLVLVSGTPCQVAALNKFLGKTYDNLVTCEVVCHGIPINVAWRKYRQEKEKKIQKQIFNIEYRNKTKGWFRNQYKFTYDDGSTEYEESNKHLFHAGYLFGFFYRPSCGTCPFAQFPRVADITLADYWGYDGNLFSKDLGISLVLANNEQALIFLKKSVDFLAFEETIQEKALACSRHIGNSPFESPKRQKFVQCLLEETYHKAAKKYIIPTIKKKSLRGKFINVIDSLFRKILLKENKYNQTQLSLIRNCYGQLAKCSIIFDFEFADMIRALLNKKQNCKILSDRLEIRALAKIMGKQQATIKYSLERANLLFAFRDACVLMAKKSIPVYFYNIVQISKNFTYSKTAQKRMKNHISFPVMYNNMEKYEEHLRELFGSKYSREYVSAIGKIPQVMQIGDYYCHEDCKSEYVNVVNGKRITAFQPLISKKRLHVYGRCGAFGYAVEDSETLPSQIQKKLIDNGIEDIKVINHGLWAAGDNYIDANFIRDVVNFNEDDIVLFYRDPFETNIMADFEKLGLRYHEISDDWHSYPEAKSFFYDIPGHMTATGYKNAAELIVTDLLKHNLQPKPVDKSIFDGFKNEHLTNYLKTTTNTQFQKELDKYIENILEKNPQTENAGKTNGAIVMNCNPFTNGHRYLIEYAAQRVDRLQLDIEVLRHAWSARKGIFLIQKA